MTRLIHLPVLTVILLAGCGHMQSQQDSQTARQAGALRELRDSGVLSEAEYQQKLKYLKGAMPAAHAQLTSASSSGAGNIWHMKRAVWKQGTTLDPIPYWNISGRPGKDVEALTMLIPTDWSFEAGAPGGPGDCNHTPGRVAVNTIAPDKTAGLNIIPGRVSMWSSDRGLLQAVQSDNQKYPKLGNCTIEQPQPLSTAIVEIAHHLFPRETQIAGPMQPVPGLSDKLPALVAQANRTLAQQGSQIQAEAGRLPVRGSSNGTPTEGFLTVMQVIRTDRLANGTTVISIDHPLMLNTFGPAGKFAAMQPMFSAMLDSVRIDPEYEAAAAQASANSLNIIAQMKQRLNQIAANMAADNANAARQQAAIRAGVQAYSNQVHANVAASQSAALDHSTQQFALYMGDQAIYKDPTTGAQVQLSSQYSHAYANTTGNNTEYILTDSPSYNPGPNWTQLQQQH